MLGTADSIGALVRFAEAMGQEFRQRDLDELAADGLLDVEGRWWRFRSAVVREVAYQTLTKRVRAQRHAGVAAVLAERGASIDDVAHHAATAAELLAELGTVDGVSPTITDHAVRALHEAATAAARHRPLRRPPSAPPAGRSTCHPRDPEVERGLLLVRAEAELERRKFAEAVADAEEVLAGALGRRRRASTRARPAAASAASPRCRATCRRRGASSARPSTCSARPATSAGLANALRARGFAEVFGGSLDDARWLLDEAMDIYHRIDDERGHAWTHQNLAWVAFQAGDFADAEVQLAEAKERFEALGDANGVIWADGSDGLRPLLPAPLRRGRGAGRHRRGRRPPLGRHVGRA